MGHLLKTGLAVAGLALLVSSLSTAGEARSPAGQARSMAGHALPSGTGPTGPTGPTGQAGAESGPVLELRARPGNVQVFPGRILKLRARVKNSGDADSGRVRIKAVFPKRRLTRTRPVNRRIPSVPAGKARKGRFAFKVLPRYSSSARFKVRFQLIERGKVTMTDKSNVVVPPIRILAPITIKVPVTG